MSRALLSEGLSLFKEAPVKVGTSSIKIFPLYIHWLNDNDL
jgi:hypothetical protein